MSALSAPRILRLRDSLLVGVFARRFEGLVYAASPSWFHRQHGGFHARQTNFEGKSMKIQNTIRNFPATTEARL